MSAFQIIIYIIMILLSLFLAANFTMRRAARINEPALIFKTMASVCFVLLGFVAYWGAKNTPGMMVLPGLVAGLVGDIYLDMKFVYPESDALYTYVGFGAFLLGHIFYFIFLIDQYGLLGTGFVISLILGIIFGFAVYMSEGIMRLKYGRFKLISAFYGGFLFFVTIYSAFVCFNHFTAARFLFFVGLLSFLASDLVLSKIYFGKEQNTPLNSIINHSAYYFAQILIAASIFFI